jgi:hypothetical protein
MRFGGGGVKRLIPARQISLAFPRGRCLLFVHGIPEGAMFRWVGSLFICVLLAGCVSAGDLGAVSAGTTIVPDVHLGSTTVEGPIIRDGRSLFRHRYTVRSWINPDKPKVHNRFQIVVLGEFERRVYLSQAYAAGEKLETLVIDRERRCSKGSGCHTLETIGIGLSEAEVERYAATGLAFKIVGRRDEIVMEIPATYFAGVLERHRRERERLARAG